MADRTVTEAELDPRKLARSPVEQLGVVVAHCRGNHPWTGVAVEASRIVGRDPSVQLVVDDVGVSRAHVRLENRGDALLVTDLGSRNGTWLNGTPVAGTGVLASVGAVIRLAKTLLVVVRDVSPYLEERTLDTPGLVGGAGLDAVRDFIDAFAATDRPILILGQTGTGKEIVARALHEASGRSGQFVALNCAAVPAALVDAELFGHARGAFSDAVASRAGLFRNADRGTLFLDEVAELPAAAQAKLLRVLESGEVRAVGSDATGRVDVRVVAATNRDLDAMSEAGDFRTDLIHRIAGLRVLLPALEDRIEDVPNLVHHFVQNDMGMSVQALEHLMLQSWPGNVRELRNVVLAAVEVARHNGHPEIEVADVAAVMTSSGRAPLDSEDARLATRIKRALRDAEGDVPRAAERLSMSRSALYESMRRLGIEARPFRTK